MEYAPPIEATVAYAPVEERVAYLRRVGLITAFGLAVAAVTAVTRCSPSRRSRCPPPSAWA